MEIKQQDIVNSISNSRVIEFTEQQIESSDYNIFSVNLFFSKFEDTIFLANELNCMQHQPTKYEHYLYLQTMTRKRKRKSTFIKKDKKREDNIKAVMDYYEYSRIKAKEAIQLFESININIIDEIKAYGEQTNIGVIK